MNESINGGTDTVQSSISYTLADNFENLVLSGYAVAGTGNSVSNLIAGNSLDNTLTDAAGNDTLDGGAGNDTLAGGIDNDTYVIDSSNDVVIENFNAGTDIVLSSITYSLGANIENLTLYGTA